MKHLIRIFSLAIALCMIFTFAASAETASPIYSADDLFTSRDYEQTADLSDAVSCTVSDGQDIHITAAGVYVITGSASNVTVYVEAGTEDKVQLVLDGVNVTNANFPVIYVKTADKVFVTVSGDSALSVTGSFAADGSTKTDGVIFSKTDLTLNGTASLTVSSTDNGIVCKDDLKITGGTLTVTAASKAIDANDSIRVAGGALYLTAGTDGLHAENSDDDTKGFVYIGGGSITMNAGDDGIHGQTVVQIDGGTLNIKAAEGIEGTYIQFNGGTINIQSTDDGVNAAYKSSAYAPTVEINGGDITVAMGAGDTDGIDSNGNIIVNGGTVTVTGNSTFDYDGAAQYNGGTIIANGQQIAYIPNQMMGGGGMMGGRGGWGNANTNDSFGMGGSFGGGGFGGGRGGRGGW
jgi:hypothetical protein